LVVLSALKTDPGLLVKMNYSSIEVEAYKSVEARLYSGRKTSLAVRPSFSRHAFVT
jgi:hypothetical protein